MKLWRICWVAGAVLVGCDAGDDPSLQLNAVVEIEDNCDIPANPDLFQPRGAFDPRVASSYLLYPQLTNRLTPTSVNNQQFFGDDALLAESNVLTVLGFDVCYVRGDDERLASLGSFADGVPLDCETDGLPGEFVGASGTIPPGLGTLVLGLPVLGEGAQRALFGEDFAPAQIPSLGMLPDGSFSFAPTPATEADRDPNWGDFPQASTAVVYVLVRGVARKASGGVVESDYFAFPVEVSPGRSQAFCGPLVPTLCPDGTNGLEGEALEGCNVGSFLRVDCAEFTTCPDT